MVAKSDKSAKAKTAPKKAARPATPAKKSGAPASRTSVKPTKTKVLVKSPAATKAKSQPSKPTKAIEPVSAPPKKVKKVSQPVKAVVEIADEVIIPVKPEEVMAKRTKIKSSPAPVEAVAKKGRAKTSLRDELDEDFDERDEDDDEDEDSSSSRGRSKNGGNKKARGRKRSPTEEFLVEDMDEIVGEDEDAEPILDDLDPFASTLLLDPDLIDTPVPSSAPVPPARTKRLAPRVQICADCGQQFGWLSIERLCFNCLKKKVSQRKKDEDYSGYGTEESSGGEDY